MSRVWTLLLIMLTFGHYASWRFSLGDCKVCTLRGGAKILRICIQFLLLSPFSLLKYQHYRIQTTESDRRMHFTFNKLFPRLITFIIYHVWVFLLIILLFIRHTMLFTIHRLPDFKLSQSRIQYEIYWLKWIRVIIWNTHY